MKSMTGYGRGESAQDGYKITVELSSINRRQGEISVFLPRELEALEPQVRDEINRKIARGRITARISLHVAEGTALPQILLNAALAQAYAREFQRLAQELNLAGAVTLDLLARAPGVLQSEQELANPENFWPVLEKALRQALGTMIQMREREGAHLQKVVIGHVEALRKSIVRIKKQAPKVARQYEAQLAGRLKEAGIERAGIPEQRWLQEIVLFADRSDISEEINRLQSHFQQFEDCLKKEGSVGRTLDFLAQEMNREINTIGSKANDSLISREVVILKTELEKFREQVQNVE